MRRVLISDPHPAVSQMLTRLVARLGYQPIVIGAPPIDTDPTGARRRDTRPTPAQLRSADALLIEPAAPGALALAHTARAANPQVAIIGEGALAPGQEGDWRETAAPVGYLAKPFTAVQLDAVLQQGFARRDRMSRRDRAGRRMRHADRRHHHQRYLHPR